MVGIGADVPLVGRLAELDRIGEALAAAAAGHGRVMVVEGEAGIGKTRLLDAALDHARGLGMQVFRAHAEEFESRRPFGAVADCLGVTRSSTDPRRAEISRRLYGGPTPRRPPARSSAWWRTCSPSSRTSAPTGRSSSPSTTSSGPIRRPCWWPTAWPGPPPPFPSW